jgi:DNA-binding transcriptional ArsR family regulator
MSPNELPSEELQPISAIDPLVHSPTRLKILAYLSIVESADFTFLMHQTGLTRGNLSVNLRKLEDAGYVIIKKESDPLNRRGSHCDPGIPKQYAGRAR